MKLTLQLVIVVLYTQKSKKFRDNLLKFILHTMGSSRYYPYPPPPTPHGGHFSFRPLTPWNFRNFPTWLGTPAENSYTSKMLLRYTVMRKLIVFAIRREKILLFMLVECLII